MNLLKFTNGEALKPGIMYCIGRNYALHAKEMGAKPGGAPVVFLKPPSSYLQSGSQLELPAFSENVHYETELVIVISKECRNVKKESAAGCIAGYGIGLDLTLRDVQARAKEKGLPWAVAKGFAGSAPISDIIPASNFNGIPDFDIKLNVNGVERQSANTSEMERAPGELIEYLSSVFILEKGDIIFTGTPQGVAQIKRGDKLEAFLGDEISLEINIL